MRKIISTILLTGITVASAAQTTQDALKFSENNYYGTARTIAMGNAFTALGGDLGSVGINPAGSAINNYSQFTITSNVSIAATSSWYDAMPGTTEGGFGSPYRNSSTKFTLPNIGFILNYKTGRNYGLKNVSFGFVANATSNYLDNTAAGGTNTSTTIAGSMAAAMSGAIPDGPKAIPYSGLNSDLAYNSYDWLYVTGYKSGMVAAYGSGDTDYIGVTEKQFSDGSIRLADAIGQNYGRQARGYKYDMVFNFGLNFSDQFYFGANLGITSTDYSMNQYFKETALNPGEFSIQFEDGSGSTRDAYFKSLRYRYAYDASAVGVYAKVGFIAAPGNGFRFGAAIQTPTATLIKEHYQHAGDTDFSNSSFDTSVQSPRGEYEYRLRSPYRVNAGVAYTFGSFGLVSADYELCDYGTMKFSESETNDNSAFSSVNSKIRDYCGTAHQVRIGAEIKPVPSLAIRAGYNLTTSAGRYYDDNGAKVAPKSYRNSFAAGLGYNSGKSFYADLSVRNTVYPYEYIYPYVDYIYDVYKDNDGKDHYVWTYTPEIRNRLKLWDVTLTLGFRF